MNIRWVGAAHLQIGDKIKQADGGVGVVANVVTVGEAQEMFTLTVDTVEYLDELQKVIRSYTGFTVFP